MNLLRRAFPWLFAALLAAVALVAAGPRGAIDWSRMRAVALESDDWGLAGFVPDSTAWAGLRREELAPGAFPAVYWNSTLEDSASVVALADVLAAHRGRDGLPAVLQPNYVMSALAWEDGDWRRHDLPDLPRAYRRPGLWAAVAQAERRGVWYPEFHAAWHYDPDARRAAVAAGGVAATAAARGIMLFPGSESAREIDPRRSAIVLAGEFDQALGIFRRAFGRAPGSIIAPDYTWDDRAEDLWASRSLTVIQAKREQRHPRWSAGIPGRALKVLDRQWSRAMHAERTYLERNCRLEPVQSLDPTAIVDACVRDTGRAWRRGEPAIVETHRVNFAHGERTVARRGRDGLEAYLTGVAALPGGGPVFLTDVEVAGLARQGASVRSGGSGIVVRNGTHSRRLVALPDPGGGPGAMRTLAILDSGVERSWP